MDWAFWAAEHDAGAAVADGARIGRHSDTLLAPLATAVPELGRPPAPDSTAAADDAQTHRVKSV
jgi:hypothetical protein